MSCPDNNIPDAIADKDLVVNDPEFVPELFGNGEMETAELVVDTQVDVVMETLLTTASLHNWQNIDNLVIDLLSRLSSTLLPTSSLRLLRHTPWLHQWQCQRQLH